MLASLDVLDYQTGLDAALAQRGPDGRALLEPALRKQAMRDVRRTIDAMAFRFALLDDRPLPEDLDYVRALEAIKPPEAAAPVLARRRPIYQRVRRRRLATSWTILAAFLLFAGGLVYVATLEDATELAFINDRRTADQLAQSTAEAPTDIIERKFVVDANVTRLRVDGTAVLAGDGGSISIFLTGPDGRQYLGPNGEVFVPKGGNYLRENVYAPLPGEWTITVIYGGPGSVRVTVLGVTPAR